METETNMSDIHFNCATCGQKIVTDGASAGQETACPTCGANILVPTASADGSQSPGNIAKNAPPSLARQQQSARAQSKGQVQDVMRLAWRGAMQWGSMGLMVGCFLSWSALKSLFADPKAPTVFVLQAGGTALAGAIIGALIGLVRAMGAAASGNLGHPEESQLPALIKSSASENDEERLLALIQLDRLVGAHKITDRNSQRHVVRAFARSLRHFGLKNQKLAVGLVESLARPELYQDPATHQELVPALPVLIDIIKSPLSDLGNDATMSVLVNAPAVIDRALPSLSFYHDAAKKTEVALAGAAEVEDLVQEMVLRLCEDGKKELVSRILANIGPKAAPATDLLVKCLSDKSVETSCAVNCAIALGHIGPAANAALPALEELMSSKPSGWNVFAAERYRSLKPHAEDAIKQIGAET